tara:strand:+ start:5903 stop:6373 length:471 start_codon:yes stop_codon:yes gene_type:complete
VSIFTIIPNELIADHGLTLIETRVLCALYSFRDPKSTRPVWPGRGAISERCGYHPDVISRTTTSLERKGWIRKIRRGKKQSNYYEILGKSDLTDPVSTVESDATELVRCDLTEPVASIGTDHLTDHNNRRPNGNLAKSAAGRALLAEQRIANKGHR